MSPEALVDRLEARGWPVWYAAATAITLTVLVIGIPIGVVLGLVWSWGPLIGIVCSSPIYWVGLVLIIRADTR